MSRAFSIVQALAQDSASRHTAKALETLFPQTAAVLQAHQDNLEDQLSDRFIAWAREEGLNLDSDNGLHYDDERVECAWLAVKAMVLGEDA